MSRHFKFHLAYLFVGLLLCFPNLNGAQETEAVDENENGVEEVDALESDTLSTTTIQNEETATDTAIENVDGNEEGSGNTSAESDSGDVSEELDETEAEPLEDDEPDSEETNIFDIMANASRRFEVLGLDPLDVVTEATQLESNMEIDVLYGGTEDATINGCFLSFDVDKNESLSMDEFDRLLKRLFKDQEGHAYYMDMITRKTIFDIFDKSGDELINKDEFVYCWRSWIKKIVRPVSAFLVIDVQNDFIDGPLAIKNGPAGEDGAEVINPINELLESVPFDVYAYSMDWHPEDHISFFDNLQLRKLDPVDSPKWKPEEVKMYDEVVFQGQQKVKQVLWPRHAVQNTSGAELHKDLKVHPLAKIIKKGYKSDIDSYSAFSDPHKLVVTELESILRSNGVTDVYICGVATDYCVGYTASHAQDLGFRTILIEDCCRGIDPDGIKRTKKSIVDHNGAIVQAADVMKMVNGQDRRPELGYQLAKDLIYNYSSKVQVRALPFGHWYPKGRSMSNPQNFHHLK